jgi:tripartite-type tricarboxylate transporter receptor subunit TctC
MLRSLVKPLFVALAFAFTHGVLAQGFVRPVHIINPFPAGGTLDTVVRLIAQKMSEQVGQPVVVENRTGASGLIGLQAAAKAPADGHNMVAMANSFAVAPAVRSDLPYDPHKDFVPVTFIGRTPHVLAVHASSSLGSVQDLVAQAKQKPESVSYGTLGDGTYSHLVGVMFEKQAGVKLLQVPFRGSAPSIAALVANQITMVFGNLPEIMPQVKAGKLKALAVASPRRSPLAPELPTLAEAGFPGFTSESWYGFLAPGGTPPERVVSLQREVARALAQPDVKERLAGLAVVPGGEPPAEFASFLREQMATYAAIVREANIKVEGKP